MEYVRTKVSQSFYDFRSLYNNEVITSVFSSIYTSIAANFSSVGGDSQVVYCCEELNNYLVCIKGLLINNLVPFNFMRVARFNFYASTRWHASVHILLLVAVI